MLRWLVIFILFPIWASGQYFHQIPECYDNVPPVQYTIDRNPTLEYSYEIIGGEILDVSGDNVLVQWYTDGELIVISENDLGCVSNSSLSLTLLPCNQTEIYVPNTFTPNDDLHNDLFTAKGVNLNYYEMTIFNRWGETLYFTRNILGGWNGYYRGRRCPNDVYIYQIIYQDHENYYHTLNGRVVLMR